MDETVIKIRVEFSGGSVNGEKVVTIEQDAIKATEEIIQRDISNWLNDRINDAHSNYLEKREEHFDHLSDSSR
ncbi:hypothetical protein [Rhizobium leguminosarum]|uniref:hypothetical protein n=1 Tax=Rhizobium leguminosarum TaxID=384 RepID=UPI0015FC430A|nr:hypothetical protein [Rhizobium leguminosarum]MBA9034919.1 hypothetical protein [Rhizobium leguminosarum]